VLRLSPRLSYDDAGIVSKKIENHAAAIALHFQHCNFARPHKSVKNPIRGPGHGIGRVADHVWDLREIAGLLD
jgi:hypothetical protein